MNERLRLLREEIGISRAVFGQRIGVSGDVINNLERCRVEIKEHILKLICSEFNVNESWLRDGTGEMFVELDVEDQRITAFMEAVLEEGKGSFRRRVILGLSAMDGDGWKALEQFLGSVCHEPQ